MNSMHGFVLTACVSSVTGLCAAEFGAIFVRQVPRKKGGVGRALFSREARVLALAHSPPRRVMSSDKKVVYFYDQDIGNFHYGAGTQLARERRRGRLGWEKEGSPRSGAAARRDAGARARGAQRGRDGARGGMRRVWTCRD